MSTFNMTPASGSGGSADGDLAAAQAAYLANADYEEANSATRCKAFMTACRKLLMLLPKMAGTRESHLQMSPELIQAEIKTAQQWIEGPGATAAGSSASSNGGPRVTKTSFCNFRC